VVVGSGILLVYNMWFHIGCFDVNVFRVTLQRMSRGSKHAAG